MMTSEVTADGEITLPAEILDHLGVKPGDEIQVSMRDDGRLHLRAERDSGSIADNASPKR